MDSQVIERSVQAISCIYSPQAGGGERRDAQAFCEHLKEEPLGPIYGHHLAHRQHGHAETVRYFGLVLIEHAIRHKWSSDVYTDAERSHIRSLVMDLVSHGFDASDKPFFREKLARLFAELVEREWPQRWPDLQSFLLQSSAESDLHLHISVLVLQFIAEDIFIFPNPITTCRKDDLRSSLIALLSSYTCAAVPTQVYQQCGISPGDQGWLSRIVDVIRRTSSAGGDTSLLVSCINALGCFIDWIPFEVLRESQLAQNLFLLLDHSSSVVQLSACESLVVLSGRVFSDWSQANEVILVPLLSDDAVRILESAWARNHGSGVGINGDNLDLHLSEEYPFLKRLAQLWSDIGTHHIGHKRVESLPLNFERYLQIILQLTRHSSLTIVSIAVSTWLSLIRSELVVNSEAFLLVLPDLFQLVAARANKYDLLPADDEDSLLGGRYSEIDFGDLADFQVAFGSFKSQMVTIVKYITAKDPLHALSLSCTAVRGLGTLDESATRDHLNANGLLTTNSKLFCQWDAVILWLNSVISAIPSSLRIDNQQLYLQLKSVALKTFSFLIDAKLDDPLIINRQLEGLTSFTSFLDADCGQQAFALLKKAFTFISFVFPHESPIVDDKWSVSEDTIALRRKGCSSLLRLALGIPDLLMSIYSDISNEIERLSSARVVTLGERVYLEDFKTAIIVNSSISLVEKQRLFQPIFDSQLVDMFSQGIVNASSDYNAFVSLLGLDKMSSILKPYPDNADLKSINLSDIGVELAITESTKNMRFLHYVLNGFKSCLARTVRTGAVSTEDRDSCIAASPWAMSTAQTLPIIFGFIRNLHLMWSPSMSNSIPPQMKRLLEMSELEQSIVVNMGNSQNESHRLKENPSTLDAWLKSTQNFLRLFREILYGTIGQITYLGRQFYGVSTSDGMIVSQLVLDSLFGSVTAISHRHWKSLIHFFITPFITNCPGEYFSSVLETVLPPLLSFLGQKLDSEWKDVISRGTLIGTPEEAEAFAAVSDEKTTSEQQEMISQIILRDFTREWSDCMSAVFLVALEPTEGRKTKSASVGSLLAPDFGVRETLVRFIVATDSIIQPVLFGLISSLSWKDTSVCSKSSRILTKLIHPLFLREDLHNFIANDIVAAALRALHDGYHQEGHDTVITLITEIYNIMRPSGPLIVDALGRMIPSFDVISFDSRMQAEQKINQQRKIVRDSLRTVAGVKPGQWFEKPMTSGRNLTRVLPEKMLIQNAKKAHHDHVADIDLTMHSSLLDLFEG